MAWSKQPHSRRMSRRVTAVGVVTVATVALGGVAYAAGTSGGFGKATVGSDAGGVLLPDNQRVAPLGTRTLVANARLLSSALSPDGRHVAAQSWNDFSASLTILDAATNKVLQQVGIGGSLGDTTAAADGPFYSADGSTLWMSQTADLLRFAVRHNGTVDPTPTVVPIPNGKAGYALPSGIATSADGRTLYVALNGSNALGVVDAATGQVIAQIPVGNAPRQVVVVGTTAYVSNEGGRKATGKDTTNLSYNTRIVSDPSTGAATTGTVSVVDLTKRKVTATIPVGLQPTALYRSGTALFVANANDDSMSIIDLTTNRVAQTVNVNPLPGSTVGSEADAITMPDPQHVMVALGRDNALAVYRYGGITQPLQYEGLVPTDWYPVGVAYSRALGKVVVTNDKGIGARGAPSTISKGPDTNPATGHNTYDDTGSMTTFVPPTEADLSGLTHQVFVNDDWQHLLASTPTAATHVAPVAVPAQLGQPSTIKHVFLIVKENRTYDQVLGDLGKGNGDPSLTQFGGSVTPNQHLMANRFGDFDNYYDEGTLSADGHNWLVQADATDYIEKEFGAFVRSYPAQGGDALAYQRDGFIWNAAEAVGKTAAAYGEYANYFTADTGGPTWQQWYQDSQILEGRASGPLPVPLGKYRTYSDIPSLNKILDPAYPRFNLDVPDQYRVDIWKPSFAKAEATNSLANLNLLWVPDDHTSGIGSGDPNPTAQVADNDLAVGRIVDTISHSKDWKSSAIFILEDDPQNGVDHVDGHRSTLQVVSPYSSTKPVNSDYYTQLSVVKTIEQILGIPPMNQEDRAAEPMFDAFTNTPDLAPYTVQPNQIPLTYGLTTPTVVPAAQQANYAAWIAWSKQQKLRGGLAAEDSFSPAQLNRLDWYSASGWTKAYPGDATILAPSQVPGKDVPAQDLGDG